MATNYYEMEKSFGSIGEQIERARAALDSIVWDDDIDLTDDVALPALMGLSELVALMRELREAGAELAEVPAEDDALVLVIANGVLIQKEIAAEVAHLEGVMARFAA